MRDTYKTATSGVDAFHHHKYAYKHDGEAVSVMPFGGGLEFGPMKLFAAFTIAVLSASISVPAFAHGGFNYGNWATGGAGASGDASLDGAGSIDNTSVTGTIAAVGESCNCANESAATSTSVAANNIELNGSGSATSTTVATSAAGAGHGSGSTAP